MVRSFRRGLAAACACTIAGGAFAQPVPADPLPPFSLPPASLDRAVNNTQLPPLTLPDVPPLAVPTKPAVPPPVSNLPPTPPQPTVQLGKVAIGKRVEPPSGGLRDLGTAQPDKTQPDQAQPALSSASPAPAPHLFEAYWNHGLFFRTADKSFTAHVGGVIQYDGGWYTGGRGVQTFPGGVGRFDDGVSPRRLRLLLDGSFHENVDYKLELEFNNGFVPAGLPASVATMTNAPGALDVWVTLKRVPVLGNVRLGNQKEWFSQETLNSGRFLPFLERSYLVDFHQPSAFNNLRSPGISAFRTWSDDRIFTGIGVYKNESDLLGFGVGDGQYAMTGRIGGLPVWCPEGQYYWHVGGAMSHRDPVDDAVRVRVRNQVRAAPLPLLNLVADTGVIGAAAQDLFNLQTSAAYGPLTLASEYTANLIRGARVGGGPNLGTLWYEGMYAEGLVFLTGEHREWDPKVGFFKRVVPHHNLSFKDGTLGAVEAGVRYSYLDLDDRGVNGGRLNNVTVGLTWYWNPNVRVQVNYDYLYRDGGPNPLAKGSIHSLGTRLAMDF